MSGFKKAGKLFLLNLLWILFSIPLITVGASTCAAFSVTLKLVDDEDCNVWNQFIKGFKQSWFQGILMGIITTAFSVLAVYIWQLAYKYGSFWGYVGWVIYLIIAIAFNFFAFPLIARYTNSLKNIVKNSVAIFAQFFKPSCKCVLITALEILVLILTKYFYFIGFLFLPVLIIYTISISAKEFFVKLEAKPEESEEETEKLEVEEETTESSEETE